MKKRKSKNYLIIGNVHLGVDNEILDTLSTVADEYNAQVLHTGNICTYTEKAMFERRTHRLRTFENIGKEKHASKVKRIKTHIKHVEKDLITDSSYEREAKKIKKKIDKIQASLDKYAKAKTRSKDEYDDKTRKLVRKGKEELAELKADLNKINQDNNKNVKLLAKRDALFNKIDILTALSEEQQARLEEEIAIIEEAENSRIKELKKYFPEIQFIANDEQCIGNHSEVIGDHLQISKYLDVQSVNANGDKVSSQPITDRAFLYLRQQKKSVVMPHPSPALRSYEREGLNEAWNMYTTGCLVSPDSPKRASEFYKATYLPSALLITIDEENEEFHASRLHFDKLRCDFAHRTKPAILHDGKCFTGGGLVEVAEKDMAVHSTDDHAPFEHMGVLSSVRTLLELSEAETFINGGDVGDWTSLCPHNKSKPRAAEGLRFNDDKSAVKRLMEAQTESPFLKNKVLIDANHEYWLERYVNEHPAMEGMVDQKTVYEEIIPDWEYHVPKNGEDYTYYFGDLAIRHGHKESLAKASKLFHKYLGGHFHSHNEYLRCGSAGAGCGLGPKYLEGNLTKWQNCVTTITKYKGISSFDIKSILHCTKKKLSRFSYQGEIYEVPWHKY